MESSVLRVGIACAWFAKQENMTSELKILLIGSCLHLMLPHVRWLVDMMMTFFISIDARLKMHVVIRLYSIQTQLAPRHITK
jgi:hypothetical protein